MRKSIAHQSELGFQGFFSSHIEGTVLQPCTGYAAHQVVANPLDALSNPMGFEFLTPPLVVFTGSSAQQVGFDSGMYELTLTARLETQIDDDMSTPGDDIHGQRMEALRDLLENFNTVFAWFQSSSPLSCFGVTGLVFTSERLMQQDRRLIAEFDYYLAATSNAS